MKKFRISSNKKIEILSYKVTEDNIERIVDFYDDKYEFRLYDNDDNLIESHKLEFDDKGQQKDEYVNIYEYSDDVPDKWRTTKIFRITPNKDVIPYLVSRKIIPGEVYYDPECPKSREYIDLMDRPMYIISGTDDTKGYTIVSKDDPAFSDLDDMLKYEPRYSNVFDETLKRRGKWREQHENR